MLEVVETCTDVAALGIGDPTLIPAFTSAQAGPDAPPPPHWRTDTGADGSYLVHVYVDEQPPVGIAAYLHDSQTLERLLVPSGRLLVAGEEAFFGAAAAQFGREIAVPAGAYALTAWRVERPPDVVERHLTERTTPAQRRAWSRGNALPAICAGATLLAGILAWLLFQRGSPLLAMLPLAAVAAAWWAQARYRAGETYRAAAAAYEAVERELPAVAAVLTPLP